MRKLYAGLVLWLALAACSGFAEDARIELRPRVFKTNDSFAVEYWSGKERVGLASPVAPAGIQIRLPDGEFKPVRFSRKRRAGFLPETNDGGLHCIRRRRTT